MLKYAQKFPALPVFLFIMLSFSLLAFTDKDRDRGHVTVRDSQFVVVLDPGHGGDKPGAHGEFSYEKNVTLAIALKVGDILKQSQPDIKVIYTRTTDLDVPLYERANIANRNKADLFISIHCNSTPYHYERTLIGHRTVKRHGKRIREPIYRTHAYHNTTMRGTGAYVLRIGRTDEKKEALKDNFDIAQTENADIYSEKNYQEHYSGFDPSNPTNMILLTYAASAYLRQSMDFANLVEQQFSSAGRPTIGVFQQGLAVLAGSAMPSVLIETDYINNPDGERYLNSTEGQTEIATLIADAIAKYKNEVRRSKYTPGAITYTGNEANNADAGNPKAVYNPETVYRIQLLVSETKYKPGDPIFKKLDSTVNVETVMAGSLKKYRYLMGNYQQEEEAGKKVEDIRQMGFRDAFVVPYQNGRRIGN